MKLKVYTAVALLALPLVSFANDCVLTSGGNKSGNNFSGPTTCSQVTTANVNVNGPLTLQDSTINKVTVNGPLTVQNSTSENVIVNGPSQIEKSKVQRLTTNGPATLTDSSANNIVIRGSGLRSDSNKLYLKGNTVVSGDITFVKGEGTVYQDKTAKVTGKITGAKVENLN